MDKIFIEGLAIPAQVGILPWEKTTTQIVTIDLTFSIDAKRIAQTDQIETAIDYTTLVDRIIHYLAAHRFNLIETLADRLANFLLNEFSFSSLKLSVTKPRAIAQAKGVGITIERTNNHSAISALSSLREPFCHSAPAA